MFTEEEGVKAIILLQSIIGVNETEEQAKIGWNKMSDMEKTFTQEIYERIATYLDNVGVILE